MGILNVTPDSFSDGGRYGDPEAALDRGLAMVEEGADLLDVGGESTRPGATAVEESEELRRILPVVKRLAGRVRVPISIDTMKPAVAEAALDAGASVVNDVAAGQAGERMWRAVQEARAGYVIMHMQGTPQTMQTNPHYEDVVGEVNGFFQEQLTRWERRGGAREQVVLDPGLGFGKTLTHNLQLISGLSGFTKWQRPVLLGASRKRFIAEAIGWPVDAGDRLPGSLACAAWAVHAGAHLVRVHDVGATRQAVRLLEAVKAGSAAAKETGTKPGDARGITTRI